MFFDAVPEGPPDPIFGLTGAFKADPRPNKVDLLVGIYKNEKLEPELLPAVKKAKEQIFANDLLADYLPIDGLGEFVDRIGALAFGKLWKESHSKIYAAQSVGGTGALRVGGEFIFQEITKQAFVPNPTWPNHRMLLERVGFQVESYVYYDKKRHGFDFDGMIADLNRCPEKSCVMLHAACHNPSGCDPSESEWREISRVILRKRLLPFFDFAYQGLGEGLEKDRKAIEIFMNDGHEMAIAYSCSKNFSLYCQRTGALFIVGSNAAVKGRIGSQIKRIIRTLYSNPPAHGARIAAHVLANEGLRKEWERELEAMRSRIQSTREELVKKLTKHNPHFSYLSGHKGMFSFADLDKSQVQRLISEFAIYLIDNGRISIPGINRQNIDSIADSILKVCE